MSKSADPLPTDIATLTALLAQARAERDAAVTERDRLNRKMTGCSICFTNCSAPNLAGGRRSSIVTSLLWRLRTSSRRLPASKLMPIRGARAHARAEKRRANRGALSAHLPRVHETIEPQNTNCPCCQGPMHVIGEETSERLDVIPAQFRVLVMHRPKCACRACERAVVQAPAPERVIKEG